MVERTAWPRWKKAVAPRRVYRLYPLDEAVEGTVRFGGLSLESRDLSALLEGCGMVALLGVTLGPQADTLIRRSEKLEMSRAVVLDACASALAEAQAEDCQREAEAASGLRAVGRFSPGYGDLPLEEQGTAARIARCPQADRSDPDRGRDARAGQIDRGPGRIENGGRPVSAESAEGNVPPAGNRTVLSGGFRIMKDGGAGVERLVGTMGEEPDSI